MTGRQVRGPQGDGLRVAGRRGDHIQEKNSHSAAWPLGIPARCTRCTRSEDLHIRKASNEALVGGRRPMCFLKQNGPDQGKMTLNDSPFPGALFRERVSQTPNVSGCKRQNGTLTVSPESGDRLRNCEHATQLTPNGERETCRMVDPLPKGYG